MRPGHGAFVLEISGTIAEINLLNRRIVLAWGQSGKPGEGNAADGRFSSAPQTRSRAEQKCPDARRPKRTGIRRT